MGFWCFLLPRNVLFFFCTLMPQMACPGSPLPSFPSRVTKNNGFCNVPPGPRSPAPAMVQPHTVSSFGVFILVLSSLCLCTCCSCGQEYCFPTATCPTPGKLWSSLPWGLPRPSLRSWWSDLLQASQATSHHPRSSWGAGARPRLLFHLQCPEWEAFIDQQGEWVNKEWVSDRGRDADPRD